MQRMFRSACPSLAISWTCRAWTSFPDIAACYSLHLSSFQHCLVTVFLASLTPLETVTSSSNIVSLLFSANFCAITARWLAEVSPRSRIWLQSSQLQTLMLDCTQSET